MKILMTMPKEEIIGMVLEIKMGKNVLKKDT